MNDSPISLDIKYHVDGLADDSARFRQAAQWIVERFGFAEFTVSIAIVDDETIHQLNREHLQHDWPTDVISFAFENDGQLVDGEVIASADTAKKLSRDAGWQPADELLLYVIHGMLHVAGLDDVEGPDQKKMRAQEQACLLSLGVVGAEQHLSRWEDVSY